MADSTEHMPYSYLSNDAARAAYANGGEVAYVNYVTNQANQPPSRPLQLVSSGGQRPFVVTRVTRPDTPTPGEQVSSPAAAQQTPQPAPTVQPQPLPRTLSRFRDAELRYAEITAQRRSHDRGKLVEGSRLRRHIARTFRYTDYERAVREQSQNEQARRDYSDTMDRYIGALGLTSTRSIANEKLAYMARFERAVLARQAALTQSKQDAQGNPQPSRQDKTQAWIANRWLSMNRAGKVALIALPAGAIGLSLGIATALLAAPGIVTAGVGVGATFGGRFLGTRIANAVNKYKAATYSGHAQLSERADARLRAFDKQSRPDRLAKADITAIYEDGTEREMQENARRRRLAGGLGALAAGGGFAMGNLLTHSVQAMQQVRAPKPHTGAAHTPTAQHTSTPTPGSHSGTPTPGSTSGPNTPPQPPANLGQEYPWDAAAQYNAAHHISTAPGQVWDTLHQAAAQYNAAHGTQYAYVQHGTKFWLQDGARQLTWNQLADFNNFLWNLAHS